MTLQDLATGLYTNGKFVRRLEEEVERAVESGRSYAVVACFPQRLPGEGVADIVLVAAQSVRRLVREGDIAGRLSGDGLAISLPDTDSTEAAVFAHRLQTDLTLRSHHLRNTVWDAGFACLPRDGATGQELLHAAVAAAKTRRRSLAG